MVHIVVDSGCDVSKEVIEGENCKLTHVPLNLQIDDTVYVDDENLDLTKYLEHMESSKNAVKTSAPSPSLFMEEFKTGDSIFVVTLSGKLSATYQSAVSAKDMYIEEYGEKFIHVFDSLTAVIGEGIIAIKIAELAKKGMSAIDIKEQVAEFMKNMHTVFILDKFDNLVKTGRVSPYIAKLATVLNIKPVCIASEGTIKMVDKARGYSKAVAKMIQFIKEYAPDIESRTVGITHVAAYEKAVALKEDLMTQLRAKNVIIQECRGVTTTYANRGAVMVAF
ncbi:MAG: DegV family protein [Clostridiales bacterium]|nr:DegV family protein [Clostridiales bacterium]